MRHGLDDEEFVGGWSDVGIIDEGKKQVINAGKTMWEQNIKIKRIITSDVKRAIMTSMIIESFYPNIEIEENELFREQNKGMLNGMKKDEAMLLYPEYFSLVKPDMVYKGGESLENLYNRIRNILDYIFSIEDDTLIVTHRGVINMIYFLLNNIELDMNKERFDVTHASLHELDKEKRIIRKVF